MTIQRAMVFKSFYGLTIEQYGTSHVSEIEYEDGNDCRKNTTDFWFWFEDVLVFVKIDWKKLKKKTSYFLKVHFVLSARTVVATSLDFCYGSSFWANNVSRQTKIWDNLVEWLPVA